MVYHALAFGGITLCNCATVWLFCRYIPARWDNRHLEIDAAPALIPYTEGGPDLRGLI